MSKIAAAGCLGFIMGIENLWVTAVYRVLYILLFLLAKNETENLTEVLVNAATQSWLYLILLTLSVVGWLIKQLVNIIQMKTASDACILYDISKKR